MRRREFLVRAGLLGAGAALPGLRPVAAQTTQKRELVVAQFTLSPNQHCEVRRFNMKLRRA